MQEAHSEQVGYSIAVASRRSGVRQDTIRAWERRHDAIHPARTEGGHRLYSDADVERLRLLRLATDAGHRIGHIARLDGGALHQLLESDARHLPVVAAGGATTAPPGVDGHDSRLDACLRAIAGLDEAALRRELEQASLELPRTVLVDRLLAPLIEAIGVGYDQGRLRPAHEHLASGVIGSFLQLFRAAFATAPSAPSLIAATPAHQHHELGAALAGAVAAAEGWQVVYIGSNLPAEDIAAAAHAKAATAVALSLVFPPDDPLLLDEIRRLRRLLDRRVALVVGGRAAAAYRSVLDEVGAILAADFSDFRRLLGELRAARATSELGASGGGLTLERGARGAMPSRG
jgi:DNA-binding transcriptional MerR regulator